MAGPDLPAEALTLAAVAIHDADCPDRTCSGAALGHAHKLARVALEAASPVLRAADAETIAKLKQRLEASWSREDKAGMDLIIMYGRTADLRAALARAEQITDNRDREIDVLRNRLAALETS